MFEIRRGGRSNTKVLFVAYFAREVVPSIARNIDFFQHHSGYRVHVLNLREHRADSGFLKIPNYIDPNEYEALIIHNTVAYDIRNLEALDKALNIKLSEYSGVKIILRQDEHFQFNKFVDYASRIGVDCIFSVMPQSEWQKTYNKFLPNTQIVQMLTGYVLPEQRIVPNFDAPRSIDIGYRGSIMPLSFGRLCYDKRRIGEVVLSKLKHRSLTLDISSEWADRKHGEEWHNFLLNCKCVLGVESGTDVFDIDGSVEKINKIIKKRLGEDDGSDSYAQSYLSMLENMLGEQVQYYAISPRHFEAIAAGAVQIMFSGHYSGRLTAGRHYFELERDFRNLDDAVGFLSDDTARKAMAVCAFEEVICNSQNWIESFVRELDCAIADSLAIKPTASKHKVRLEESTTSKAHNVLILQAHEFGLDPRRDHWYSVGSPQGISFHNIGISRDNKVHSLGDGVNRIILDVPRSRWTNGCMNLVAREVAGYADASAVIRELQFLDYARSLDNKGLFELFGAPSSSKEIINFKWYLNYLLDAANTLVHAAVSAQNVDAILAVNFPALMPSVIAARILDVPLIYEALEYWPEMDPQQFEFMHHFWTQLEGRIVGYADVRGTVSPHLAQVMENTYGQPFNVLPNAVPFSSRADRVLKSVSVSKVDANVRFLFQGNFAENRGLEALIDVWADVVPQAHLYLRGPDNTFAESLKKRAANLGLYKKRVHFLRPVDVCDLVEAASRDGDVALIPYPPVGKNYECCSPNKMGQYFAAGLPILANRTKFVEQTVSEANCGIVVDFSDSVKLAQAINCMCDIEKLNVFGQNSMSYFENTFHWENLAQEFYAEVAGLLQARSCAHELKISLLEHNYTVSRQVGLSGRLHSLQIEFARKVWRSLPNAARKRLLPIISRFR